MFNNDTLSDCTAAAAAHQRTAWTTYGQGTPVVSTDAQVLRFYELCSGYRPGQRSTDRGAVMQDCLTMWRKVGLGGDKILAFFQLNHTDLDEIREALWLFGGVYTGVNIPASAMTQFHAGKPWRYDPTLDNTIIGRHCVHLGAMDTHHGSAKVTTWGTVHNVTLEWLVEFTEEAWGVCSPDWINNTMSPEGLDCAALNAAFTELTGEPGPFPTPETLGAMKSKLRSWAQTARRWATEN
jgi:hypothetical protein